MKILFINNIKSGKKQKKSFHDEVINDLRLIHEITEFDVKDVQTMKSAANRIEEHDLVIIAGGDGTVSYFSNLLAKKPTPFSIIPIGSGNDFANCFELNTNSDSITSAIERFNIKDVSSFLINDEDRRLTIICFGFEAKINRLANKMPRFLGSLKYTLATLISFFGKHYENLKIETDVFSETGDYSLAILTNTPSFGGGLRISNKANPFDDKMYLILVNRTGKLKLLYLFILLILQKHYNREEFREFEVNFVNVDSTNGILRAQADGESIKHGPVKVVLQPNSLKVI